ncbi:MAG: YgiQ family radical SAM protein [Candidatus Omnitrophica bacterium]|nr:YgiQ family radical SAM protein [Candidatus Omnitrophota bacterium]
MSLNFLPICQQDLKKLGIKELDIIIVTGDAYVDHPSYGAAIIGRVLEAEGFKVGIIAQPNWRSTDDFLKLGRPKLFFAITAGNVDSMVANYTANKRPRVVDDYSPGSRSGLRPDRALIVYANKVREAHKDCLIVLGGIEASLRRLAHYDYWDNEPRRSVLLDSKADILVYGMGEIQTLEIAKRLKSGESAHSLNDIRGTVIVRKDLTLLKDYKLVPSFEEIKESNNKYNLAFREIFSQMNPFSAKSIAQKHADRFIVQLPPAYPLSTDDLDRIYGLNYARNWHPVYDKLGGIKGFETVRFSITSHRGCCGMCSFCSLYMHQGRIIQSRSEESILKEARLISQMQNFKGTITDIGGPTANLYQASCGRWKNLGFCENKSCVNPSQCKNLELGYKKSVELYRKIAQIPGVKHVFISSGFRYDLLTEDNAEEYLTQVCKFNISGQMKVAPEHIVETVLRNMNKPYVSSYEKFLKKLDKINTKIRKKTYLVNYFIASHPASGLKESLELALYLSKRRINPEQIQDFIPLPMTFASCLYYTGVNPITSERVYSAKTFKERKMQRALIQHKNPKNRQLVREALKILKAEHLGKIFLK